MVYAMASVTSRCCTKTARHRITLTVPGDSSFHVPKIFAKFDRDQPQQGRQMQVGWVSVKIGDF